MKKAYLKIVMIVACGVLSFTSCKKDSENTGVVAEWNLSEVGDDTNDNNIIDAGETRTTAQENIAGTLVLRGDNTYTYTFVVTDTSTVTTTSTGTYAFANNSLALTSQGSSRTMQVISITNNKMILKDDGGSIEWLVFTR